MQNILEKFTDETIEQRLEQIWAELPEQYRDEKFREEMSEFTVVEQLEQIEQIYLDTYIF